MPAGMFMWGGTAQRLGVHPPAASRGALTFLPRNWIQAERSLGIRFLAAGRVTFASRWRWMPMGMSVWRVGAMPPGVHPSALAAAAHMMSLSQRSPFRVQLQLQLQLLLLLLLLLPLLLLHQRQRRHQRRAVKLRPRSRRTSMAQPSLAAITSGLVACSSRAASV